MGLEESEWSASIRDPRTGVQSTEDPLSRVAEWFHGGYLARKAGNASFAGTCQERACENSTTHVVRVTCGAALPAEQACLDWLGFPRVVAGPWRGGCAEADAGLLAFRRLLRGPLPLVRAGAPARGVRPPLLRPAVLQGLLHVQPVSQQVRGPPPAPAGRVVSPPAGVPGRRETRAELLGRTTCVPVCAGTCVCVFIPGHTGTRLVGRTRGVGTELPNLLALNRGALAKQAGPE